MNDRGRRNSGGVHGGGQDPRGYGKNDAPYGNGEIPYREVHTNRKKKRKRTFGDVLRFLLMIIALGVFLYSGWTLYGFYQDYKKAPMSTIIWRAVMQRTGRVPGITMHSMMTIR